MKPVRTRKKLFIYGGTGALVVVLALYFYFRSGTKTQYEFSEARRGTVLQQVSVTGNVKPAETIDLAFEGSGRVVRVPVLIGQKVFSGTVLVELDRRELSSQIAQAEASRDAASFKLDEAKKGVRPEEIKIYEAKLQSALSSLADAKRNLESVVEDAYTKSDDAIRAKADQFFTNPRSSDPQLMFSPSDSVLETRLERTRLEIEKLLASWSVSPTALPEDMSIADLEKMSDTSSRNLGVIKGFLDDAALALNSLTANSSISQTTVDSYRSGISTARANINTAIANLVAAGEKMRTADSARSISEEELLLKRAGSTPEAIAALDAAFREASAHVDALRAQAAKSVLISPIAGIVTRVDIDPGEIASPNEKIVSLISDARFEIEAHIPEADIAKIKTGSPVRITLDAYGSDVVFEGRVVFIDPAETVIEGVPTYKTTVAFSSPDERVRSGMTANMDVTGERRENVIAISQRALTTRDSEKYVRILGADGKTVREVQVRTGLRGSDGMIEIIEGVSEGDHVITFEK